MKKTALVFLFIFQITLLTAQINSPLEIFPGVPLSSDRLERQNFERLLAGQRIFFSGSPSLRNAFLRNRKVFGAPAVEMRASYNNAHELIQVDIIYANKGDFAQQKNLGKFIQRTVDELETGLTARYGKPKRKQYGHKRMQNRVSSWQHGISEIILDHVRNEYVMIHIHIGSAGSAASDSREAMVDLKGRDFSGNVKKNDFGDVFIYNVPMINQGNKGYCVPATVERVLRYYGITQINMHLLADAAKTKKGGGTTASNIFDALASFRRAAGLRKLSSGEIRISVIKKYIDQGVPIFWLMYVNQPYESLRKNSRRLRHLTRSSREWKKKIRRSKVPARGEPHMCLIIGYNEDTEEIAVTNSWGDHEISPSWVPVKVARKVSQGRTFVLAPR